MVSSISDGLAKVMGVVPQPSPVWPQVSFSPLILSAVWDELGVGERGWNSLLQAR